MTPIRRGLTPAQAGTALGVSAKTLRLYERHGLLTPDRTRTGWRAYDAGSMARATDIVALRRLGFSLAAVARILDGGPRDRATGLAEHEARLRDQGRRIVQTLARVRSLRADLAAGRAPAATAAAMPQRTPLTVGFALPWPWGGEWFALADVPCLAFITGPLGSGKTRLARMIADALPDAAFLGLDRLSDPAVVQRLADDPEMAARVERRTASLVEDGAECSDALTALLAAIEASPSSVLVVDMVEEGLKAATQTALMAQLRRHRTSQRALILMTRSSAILDLGSIAPTEVVIVCPANHSVPLCVVPYPGGPGYEAVATCLAPPDVRARTAGMVAMRAGQPETGRIISARKATSHERKAYEEERF